VDALKNARGSNIKRCKDLRIVLFSHIPPTTLPPTELFDNFDRASSKSIQALLMKNPETGKHTLQAPILFVNQIIDKKRPFSNDCLKKVSISQLYHRI
jgi:hypothetical protein